MTVTFKLQKAIMTCQGSSKVVNFIGPEKTEGHLLKLMKTEHPLSRLQLDEEAPEVTVFVRTSKKSRRRSSVQSTIC